MPKKRSHSKRAVKHSKKKINHRIRRLDSEAKKLEEKLNSLKGVHTVGVVKHSKKIKTNNKNSSVHSIKYKQKSHKTNVKIGKAHKNKKMSVHLSGKKIQKKHKIGKHHKKFKGLAKKKFENVKLEINKLPLEKQGDKPYSTDLDRLFDKLKSKKVLSFKEISVMFKIHKKIAEEWCKILEDHGLAKIKYPALGDGKLIWKE